MNYELCKKLKEAGFPPSHWIGGHGFYYLTETIIVTKRNVLDMKVCGANGEVVSLDSLIYIPTLSEFIAECGAVFTSLEWLRGVGSTAEWEATAFENHEQVAIGEGRTPEEAVANLYLALNET